MRVLALLTEAFGGQGGIALYNRDLLTAICRQTRCKEVVAIPRLTANYTEPLPEKLKYVTSGIGNKFYYIANIIKLVHKDKGYDLIICGHLHLLPIAFLLKKWLKVPIVQLIYGIDSWKVNQGKVTNLLVGKIDCVISISEITRTHFLDWSHVDISRTHLLPNAIHSEFYGIDQKLKPLLKRYQLQNKIVIMTLGRMSTSERYKGFDEILETLPKLVKKEPRIVYMAVGGGDDRQRLLSKAEELGISNHFVMTGYIPEEEKADYYRLADAYIMPSYGEGFGFVILEAMACGIPVVASKKDGTREAVRNGKLGLLVDPSDKTELESAILEALSKPKQIPDGLDYFSFQHFEQRLRKIIDNTLGVEE